MKKTREEEDDLGLTDDEIAFYDALMSEDIQANRAVEEREGKGIMCNVERTVLVAVRTYYPK